ncbi:MAG: sugar phosphate isomerase/epimerase family protein [Treponemataceae bacterium]
MATKLPVSVQSFCFRDFKENSATAKLVKELGLSGIEICGKHCDFAAPASFSAVVGAYRAAGVSVVSAGVVTFSQDAAMNRNFFEFARAAGAQRLSVNFKLESLDAALKSAEALAEEYDIRLGLHNHGGKHWLGSSEALSYLFSRTSKRVGLCLDTAWTMDSGEDPLLWTEKYGDRLVTVHLKDFVYSRERKHEDVVIGTGCLDLGALDAALAKVGYRGPLVIEYEGDSSNPVPALKDCVLRVKKSMPSAAL